MEVMLKIYNGQMTGYGESGSAARKVGMNCRRIDIDYPSPVVPRLENFIKPD
jgi:hypothetical protein